MQISLTNDSFFEFIQSLFQAAMQFIFVYSGKVLNSLSHFLYLKSKRFVVETLHVGTILKHSPKIGRFPSGRHRIGLDCPIGSPNGSLES